MSRVFVSYRRDDSAGAAGRIYERLVREFGAARVFMDVEGGIPHGADFPTEIARALHDASALLVVIGRHWASSEGADGRPRIQDDADWVVTEIATGLERGILVLPVLVDGAVMPQEGLVSKRIAALARKQAVDIRASTWQYDLDRIVAALTPVVGTARGAARRRAAMAVAVAAVAIAPLVVVMAPRFRTAPEPQPTADGITPVVEPAPAPAPGPAQRPGASDAPVTPAAATDQPRQPGGRGGRRPREGPDPAVTPAPPPPQPAAQPPSPLPAAAAPAPAPQPLSLRDQAIAAAERLNPNDERDARIAKQALERAFGMTGNQLLSLRPAEAVDRVRQEIRATNDQERLEAALQYLR